MGYRQTTYTGSVFTAEASFGNPLTYAFLDIDDYNRNFVTNTLVSTNTRALGSKPSPSAATSYIGNNLIARIAFSTGEYTSIVDSDKLFKPRDYFGPVRIDKARIRLIDKFGFTVNLQNDYSFVLDVTCIY
jgi:hypothetical protein